MHIRNLENVVPIEAPSGEVVRELAGESAEGLSSHSIAHITIPAGKSSLKHYHPKVEESYYILSGEGRMVMDGKTQILNVGDLVAIPAPKVHQIFNDGNADLVFIATCAPSWTPDCSVFLEDD